MNQDGIYYKVAEEYKIFKREKQSICVNEMTSKRR